MITVTDCPDITNAVEWNVNITCFLQDKKDGKEGNILDFVKMEDEDSNEPMSLADRLKLKGSPVEALKGGAAKEKKPKAAKGENSSLNDMSTIMGH